MGFSLRLGNTLAPLTAPSLSSTSIIYLQTKRKVRGGRNEAPAPTSKLAAQSSPPHRTTGCRAQLAVSRFLFRRGTMKSGLRRSAAFRLAESMAVARAFGWGPMRVERGQWTSGPSTTRCPSLCKDLWLPFISLVLGRGPPLLACSGSRYAGSPAKWRYESTCPSVQTPTTSTLGGSRNWHCGITS